MENEIPSVHLRKPLDFTVRPGVIEHMGSNLKLRSYISER